MNFPKGLTKQFYSDCASLVGQTDAEWIGWRYNQAYRGNGHIKPSRTSNIPFTALTVVPEDGLIALINHLLWSTKTYFQLSSYTLLIATNIEEWIRY